EFTIPHTPQGENQMEHRNGGRPFHSRATRWCSTAALVGSVLLLAPPPASATLATLVADAYTKPGSSTNHGKAGTLIVGANYRSSLKFDFPPLPRGPTGSDVKKATLTPYVNALSAAGTVAVEPVSANAPWAELTLKSNNEPSLNASAAMLGSQVSAKSTFV